jgi:hypothetical protein
MKRLILGICLSTSLATFAAIDDGATVNDRLNALEEQNFKLAASQGGNIFKMYGDYLYWRSYARGLSYATTYQTTTNGFGTNFKFIDFNQSYNSGFRVGAEYETPFDQWTIDGVWTRFSQNASDSVTSGNKSLMANWDLSGKLTASTAGATMFERLEIVDGTIGKNLIWSTPFTLKYEIGGRGVWLDEHMRANYTGTYKATSTSSTYAMQTQTYVTNAFSGIGFLNGLSAAWNLGCGFSIYGGGNFSLLWGKFVVNANQTTTIESPIVDHDSINYQSKFDAIKTNLDGSIGLKWAWKVFHKDLRITLKAGYEFSYWPNQVLVSRAITFPTIPSSQPLGQVGGSMTLVQEQGDVSFQGYVFGLMLDF